MIAVIGATHAELRGVLALMRETRMVTQKLPVVYEGRLEGVQTVLILSGIGKSNAVNAADHLFMHYPVDTIFSIGVAGALDPKLQKGDIVIGSSITSVDAFDRPDCFSDPALGESASRSCGKLSITCHAGKLLTVPAMVASTKEKAELRKRFDALAIDMETCHVAHGVLKRNTRFLALRAISDSATQSLNVDFSRLRRGRISTWFYFLCHPGAYAEVRGFSRDIAAVSDRLAFILKALVTAMPEMPDQNKVC